MSIEHSRAMRLAAGATALPASELATRLDSATIVISVDPDMPQAALLARVFLTTLRRGPGILVLNPAGLPGPLVESLRAACHAIDPDRPLRVTRSTAARSVRVHLGPSVGSAIRVVPDGCGAHLATSPAVTIRPVQPGNPLGVIFAAALGAAELFKQTAQVIATRRTVHRYLRFCPVTLLSDLRLSPSLAPVVRLDLALIGVGAIGTAIALILSELDVEGTMIVVDRQKYARENRGTYSLGGATDGYTEPWKVDLAQQALARFDVHPFYDDVADLLQQVDRGDLPWMSTVLTALDSPDARRTAQRLWPDRLIDAATGDTMLGLHDHRHGLDPCMMCHFPIRPEEPSGTQALADMLGLSVALLAEPDRILTEDLIADLPLSKRDRLAPHLGTTMCGLASAVDLTELDADGYQPSIPFVSMQAACLAVGRLLAATLDIAPTGNLIQYDSLIGPQAATVETMRVRPGCTCTNRSAAIEQLRSHRRTIQASLLRR